MNNLNFNQSDGFPLETQILDEMQKAYSMFNALGAIVGNFSIISGCETVGSTVTDGVVFINGEVLNFKGGLATSTVIIKEDVTQLEFEDFSMKDVIYTRYVRFGSGSVQYNWSNFKRGVQTRNLDELFAAKANSNVVNSILETLNNVVSKLQTIEEGAAVQLPSDWNAVSGVTRILNKPNTIAYLYKGTVEIGDAVGTSSVRTISFPSVGTSDYIVLGSMVSQGNEINGDNDFIWLIREKLNSSFKVILRELTSEVQNLRFDFILIPL